jgi:hypothetical protein
MPFDPKLASEVLFYLDFICTSEDTSGMFLSLWLFLKLRDPARKRRKPVFRTFVWDLRTDRGDIHHTIELGGGPPVITYQ